MPAIATYRNIDEAVERANSGIYGLGGSVWGRNANSAAAIARRIHAGTVFVNSHGTEVINRRAPYGGAKQSGLGRKCGPEGILDYVDTQTLTIWV